MALMIELTQAMINQRGKVALKRGDDWAVSGQVVDRINKSVKTCVDLSLSSATAYFPAADGTKISVSLPITAQGYFTAEVSKEATTGAMLSDSVNFYVEIQDQEGLRTVELDSPILEIRDKAFQSF